MMESQLSLLPGGLKKLFDEYEEIVFFFRKTAMRAFSQLKI